VTTAAKREECPGPILERTIAQMIELNAIGRDALQAAGGAHALTDVTGYGLAGHALEMAEGCGLTFVIEVDQLPLIAGAEILAVPRYHSRASKTNVEFLAGRIRIDRPADDARLGFAFDPQTSGGLLIAIDPTNLNRLIGELRQRGASAYAVIGRVVERAGDIAIHLV
jgi:selenide,water dikinase